MGVGKKLVEDLGKLFKEWDFLAIDENNIFGGLIIGWRTSNIHLLNSSFIATSNCTSFLFQELGHNITIINYLDHMRIRILFEILICSCGLKEGKGNN